MTNIVAAVAESDADIRWRHWQARGAESDRRTTTRMRTLTLFIVASLGVWFAIQLT